MPKKTQVTQKKPEDYEQLGRLMVAIYESGYLEPKKALKSSFLKGVFSGLGGVVGATIMVALLLWLLSLFHQVPIIGPFVNKVRSTVELRTK
ncbi:MAG TPA: DUF5665 domain-containing protein [Candidatus Saccharimonadales bacterium]|nr:DUF5665 domain-containing protein [Candidatus Saccharimonadales bacterium]